MITMTWLWPLVITVLKIVAIIVPVLFGVAYLTYAERKIIGAMQCRVGPSRVGPLGLLQPIVDGIKLLLKEMVWPKNAVLLLYILAPAMAFVPALLAWSVIPFNHQWVLVDMNVGLIFLLALTSLSVYGIILAGWSSHSKYAWLGCLRSAAQVISYEIAMGFALVGVVMLSHTLQLSGIIAAQSGGMHHWFIWPLFPLAVVYWIAVVAETNRAPFDMAEGESEIVAGFHVEYAGMSFAIFFLAEYANMLLLSVLASTLFLGGWLSPFQGIPILSTMTDWVPGIFWLLMKTGIFLFLFLWFRATFPRYRYDQIMRLGWKILIPVSFFWVVVIMCVQYALRVWG